MARINKFAKNILTTIFMMVWNKQYKHFLTRLGLTACLLLPALVSADSFKLRSQWQQDLHSTQQLHLELVEAQEQMNKETRLKQIQLREEARNFNAALPSASALRDARLDLETQSAWAKTLQSRANYRQREINGLNQELAASDDPLLERLIERKVEFLDTLEEFNTARRARVYIASERLAQLQSRIDLWSVGYRSGFGHDASITLIERVIAGLIRNSVRLTNKATELAVNHPQDTEQRLRLEFEADDAAVRATLRQTDMDMLRLDQWLEIVDSILEDDTMPVAILLQGRDALGWTETQLQHRIDSLSKRRRILDTQKSIANARRSGSRITPNNKDNGLLNDMENLVNFQEQDLKGRLWRIGTAQKEMTASMEAAYTRSLLMRHTLPRSGQDWLRVTDSLMSAPKRLISDLGISASNIYVRFSAAPMASWMRLLGVILLLTLLAAGIKRWLAWLLPSVPASLWHSVASATASVTWWLVPIGGWLSAYMLFDLSTQMGQRGMLLLLIWPAYRISNSFIRHIYATQYTDWAESNLAQNDRLRPRTKIFIAVAILFGVLSHWINTAPIAATVFDRMVMLGLFALAITAFPAQRAHFEHQAGYHTRRGNRIFQVIIGLVLIASVIGFLGYTSLAWLILYHLFWLISFATFAWLMICVIRATTARLNRNFAKQELSSGGLWLFSILRPLSWLTIFLLGVALLYLLLAVFTWGVPSPLLLWLRDASGLNSLHVGTFLLSEPGRRLSSSVIDITIALFLAYIIWELVKRSMMRYMPEEDGSTEIGGEGGGTGASRISTLMPLLSKLIFITISIITLMVVLSALGVNIGPLLAGAGVVGIAVGFGAQALVKDIISGVFFLMDDSFRMGEYVDIEGEIKGTVERISIRSLQLRHHNGPVHTIPFGEIQFLTNYSRDWAIMKFEFRIAFETDIDVVRRIIKKVGIGMLEDEEFGPLMIEPLKSQGVNRMDDSALIIRCKFTSVPGQQFYVRRQAFTLIQRAFEANDIKFASKRVIVESASPGDIEQAAAAAEASDQAPQGSGNK